MKKCPGCGSIEADEDMVCGVCSHDLRDVPPMQESIDQSIKEDAAKQEEEDTRLERQDLNNVRKEWLIGVIVGLCTLLLGFWLFFSSLEHYTGFSKLSDLGIPIGMYLMAFGIVTLETVFDLFEGAPYRTWGWFSLIAMKYERDAEAREKKAHSD